MKRKLIISTFALTVLLLSGCGQDNTSGIENTNESPTTSPAITEAPSSVTVTVAPQPTATTEANTNSNIVSHNEASTEMISEDEAKRIALEHAGLTTDQATFIKSGTDRDHGQITYDVEFYTNDHREYDYEIDPYTGKILDYDHDAEYYAPSLDTDAGDNINEDNAKQIALDQVPGATLQDIRKFKSEYDNGKLEYEGKIFYDQKEYEFEIDGYTGTILEWDVEPIYGRSFVE